MLRSFRLALSCGVLLTVLWASVLWGADTAGSSGEIPEDLRQELYLPRGVPLDLVTIATGKGGMPTEEEEKHDAPRIAKFAACHVGQHRVLLEITFARRPVFENGGLLVYIDLDNDPATGRQDSKEHRGVDLMISISGTHVYLGRHNAALPTEEVFVAGAKLIDKVLYLSFDAPLKIEEGKVKLDLRLASERRGGRSDGTRRQVVALPAVDRKVPVMARKGDPDLRPLSDYRYHNDRVKLEKLADKGLKAQQVAPANPIRLGRACPAPTFATTVRKPGQPGSIKIERITVAMLEEAGVARRGSPVGFGFPLPQGGVFDLGNVRLLAPSGKEVPAQFTATVFWPDGSLKWVLIDFAAPLAAHQVANYTVEFGNDVRRRAVDSPLKIDEQAETITVVTGPLKAEVSKVHFNLLRGVWLDTKGESRFETAGRSAAFAPEGMRLVDERGKVFTTSAREPESVRIEEQGPQKVVVRVEGAYAAEDGSTYMRYIARLVFRAGSPRVGIVYTHVNDHLETEFTDITSLGTGLLPQGEIQKTAMTLPTIGGAAAPAQEGREVTLVQLDDRNYVLNVDGRESRGARAPGAVRCQTSQGAVGAVVHDFWQRWPKRLATGDRELRIDLLPRQPGPDYGQGLPHYLLFPLVEGFYRFKWGVSFTERLTLDFSGAASTEELLAEANCAIVPVVPANWYAQTKALGRMAMPRDKQFALWDACMDRSLSGYQAVRETERTYGYLNYGDWYGERGRNWGNNEYDLAHAFFLQFARTGKRDFFRLALTAARHQADVDCVHAYPDPYYVGANHQHSIGHTGTWSQNPTHATWSHRYDAHTSADNGHTWSEGMAEAWCLAGDARVMETALQLGEHITWAMSPTFKHLGTHERSAGWSLRSIIGIYRVTYDPLYLEAAGRIAAVALREQKFDDGGAWPHVLPGDHAGGRPGARGNAIYLVAVVTGGLKELHEETHDPALAKSIVSAADWLLKCWNEEVEGWPYTALVSGEALFPPSVSANGLACGVVAYAGHVSGDPKFMDIALRGMNSLAISGAGSNGKSIASEANYTASTLELLQQWYATRGENQGLSLLSGAGDDLARHLGRARDAQDHRVRNPQTKVFLVTLRADAPQAPVVLRATSKPHGSAAKRMDTGTIQVLTASGKTVKREEFNTDRACRFACPLQGARGDVFKIVIKDDERSVWSLVGEGLGVVMQTTPGFTIGGVRRGRYHFFVPEGTKEFQVKLRAGHEGVYAGLVLSPDDKEMGFHEGTPAGVKGKTPAANAHPEQGIITVKPDPKDTGKVWSLALMAGGDLSCELIGVPPYLSLDAKAWFDPKPPKPN